MFTKNGKALTARGIKPICPFQQVFESLYLFGVFSPIDGQNYLLELPYCNTDNFQLFIDEFSKFRIEEYKIIVLDNGAFHKAKRLKVPANITLVFLPPYSPELNPAEKVWWKFKRDFTNRIFHDMNSLSDYVCSLANSLNESDIMSLTRYDYISSDPFWTII